MAWQFQDDSSHAAMCAGLAHGVTCLPNAIRLFPVQCLELDTPYDDDDLRNEEDMDAALRRLTGLTSLYLESAIDGEAAVGVLTGLTRLEQLYYEHRSADLPPLPCGPWSSSLRALGTELDCLDSSVPFLASCTALQEVFVVLAPVDYTAGPFWEWAQQHTQLRRLQIDLLYDPPPALVEAVAALRRARSDLEVKWAAVSSNDHFSSRLLCQRFNNSLIECDRDLDLAWFLDQATPQTRRWVVDDSP